MVPGRFRVHADPPLHRRQRGLVRREDLALALHQLVDTLELRTADGSLQVRHLVLEADARRPELPDLAARPAMIAQGQHPLVERGIAGDEHASSPVVSVFVP